MRPPFMNPHATPIGMGIEVFSFVLIILASFLIYYKTEKIYSLTEHKGLRYFRKGFLFFGFSYIIRIFTFFLEPPFTDLLINRKIGFITTAVFIMIALSYLVASMHYKKIEEYFIYVINLIVFAIALIFDEPIFLGIYGLVLFFTFGVSSIMKYKKSKKKMFSQIYFIYLLMFIFWIFLAFTQSLTEIFRIGRFYGGIVTAIFFMYLSYLVMHKLNSKDSSKNTKIIS